MRFECESISAAAKACAAIIDRGAIGSMASVRIDAKGDTVTLSTCSREAWLSMSVPASVEVDGVSHVSAVDLSKAVSGPVSISLDGDWLLISGKGKFKLPTASGDMPLPPGMDGDAVDVSSRAYHDVVSFADTSSHSEICQGVGFVDGFAVAYGGSIFAASPSSGANSKMIPSVASKAIPMDSILTIGETVWAAEADGVRSCGPLLHAAFPDINQLIGGNTPIGSATASEMLGAVRAAGLGRAQDVVFKFGDEATVEGANFSGPHADTSVPFYFDGVDASIVFREKQISRALGHFSNSVLDISASEKALKMSKVGGGEFIIIGMIRDHRNVLPSAGS